MCRGLRACVLTEADPILIAAEAPGAMQGSAMQRIRHIHTHIAKRNTDRTGVHIMPCARQSDAHPAPVSVAIPGRSATQCLLASSMIRLLN